jgi:hypothetical protein
MDMTKSILISQYRAGLETLRECVTKYDSALWTNATDHAHSASDVCYHIVSSTNFYMSPSWDSHRRWEGERDEMGVFGDTPVEASLLLSQERMIEFIDVVLARMPQCVEECDLGERCFPDWYEMSVLEFHLNALRHLQHHTAQLLERHRTIRELDVDWRTFCSTATA